MKNEIPTEMDLVGFLSVPMALVELAPRLKDDDIVKVHRGNCRFDPDEEIKCTCTPIVLAGAEIKRAVRGD
jgi:hypothetical protein